jgi:hypothetical protein
MELKLNGTHQLLAYADDVNLLGDNIRAIKDNRDILIDASKEVGLEINVEKTKYVLLSRHQNVSQNRSIKIARCVTIQIFGNVRIKNQNLIQEEIKRRLNSGMLATIRSRIFCLLVCCRKM